MATDIGTLAVKLVAKTGDFKRDMEDARLSVNKTITGIRTKVQGGIMKGAGKGGPMLAAGLLEELGAVPLLAIGITGAVVAWKAYHGTLFGVAKTTQVVATHTSRFAGFLAGLKNIAVSVVGVFTHLHSVFAALAIGTTLILFYKFRSAIMSVAKAAGGFLLNALKFVGNYIVGPLLSAMGSLLSAIGSLIGDTLKWAGIIGGAVVASITIMVAKSMSAINTLGKLAQRIGDSSAMLGGLQYAAEIAGPGVEAFNTSLERMTARIGDAARGSGEAKKALESMGLSVAKLAKMAPSQQLLVLSERFSRVHNSTLKASLAVDLFGRSGIQMLNFLELGRDSLIAYIREAERLGVVIPDFRVQMIMQANDALQRLKLSWFGFANLLTAELAPYITAVANQLVAMELRSGNASETMRKGFEYVLISIAKTLDFLDLAKNKVIEFGAVSARWLSGMFDGWEKVRTSIISGILEITRVLLKIPGMQKLLGMSESFIPKWLSEFQKILKGGDKPAAGASSWLEKQAEAMEKLAKGGAGGSMSKKFQDWVRGVNQSAAQSLQGQRQRTPETALIDIDAREKAEKEAQKRWEAMQKKAEELTRSVQTPQEVFMAAKAEADKLARAGLIDRETYNRLGNKAQEDLNKPFNDEMKRRAQARETQLDTEFKQVDLSRMVLGGIGSMGAPGAGGPGNPQMRQIDLAQRQLEIMRQIALNTRGPQYGLLA